MTAKAIFKSSIHDKHRDRLLTSTDESARLTNIFTGRMARSLKNDFLLEMENKMLLFKIFHSKMH